MAAWASERIPRNGQRLTRRVNALIDVAADAAGLNPADVVCVQGSWSDGSKSAGTHSGGGAFDLRVWNLPSSKIDDLVYQLRKRCGGPVWLRDQAHGGFDPHIHGIVRDEAGLSAAARQQVQDYDRGLNGLASKGRDYHPRPAWARFPTTQAAIEELLMPSANEIAEAVWAKMFTGTAVPEEGKRVVISARQAVENTRRWAHMGLMKADALRSALAAHVEQGMTPEQVRTLMTKLDEIDAEIDAHTQGTEPPKA